MATAFADSPPLVQSQLKTQWTSVNADGSIPRFIVLDDAADPNSQKAYDTRQGDLVLINLTSKTQKHSGLSPLQKDVKDLVTIDVRSGKSRVHQVNLISEIDRILDKNIVLPITGFTVASPGNWLDHSDELALLWRHTIDVEYWNPAVIRGI